MILIANSEWTYRYCDGGTNTTAMADTDGDGGVNTSDLHPLAEYLVGNAAPILLAGISAWFVLFALFEKLVRVLTAKSGLVREATPTTPPGEKPTTVQGFAFLALSTLHSTTVATLVLSTFPALVFPGPVETGTGGSIGTAGSESELASDSPGLYSNLKFGVVDGELQAVAFTAGFVYTSWALFEVLFFTLHWRVFGKFSDMFHHVLFSAAGLFFMSNQYTCGFYAVVLMGMETSTPWLNLHLAFRGSSGATRRVLGKVRRQRMHLRLSLNAACGVCLDLSYCCCCCCYCCCCRCNVLLLYVLLCCVQFGLESDGGCVRNHGRLLESCTS